MSEPMHLSVSRERTACGADRRGKRCTRDYKLVTCKHCTAEVARRALREVLDRTGHMQR